MPALIEKFRKQPRQLFLVDAWGAVLSAFLLGIVLVRLQAFFGMPQTVLYGLSLVACTFATYSFVCYWCRPQHWRFYLSIIATANLMYCCVTVGLVLYLHQALTIWDHLYFIGELPILASLIYIEFKTATLWE